MTSPNGLTDHEIRRILNGQVTTNELDRLEEFLLVDPRLVTFAQNDDTEKEPLLAILKDCQPFDTNEMQERVELIVSRLLEARPKKPDEITQRVVRKIPVNAALEETVIPTTQPEIVIPLEFDHFRVVRKLGEGGMGTVYEAEDLKLHRRVAIKTLRAEIASNQNAKDRFLREARSAASITHDNIVPIYQVGESVGVPYLAMPLLVGLPLNEILKERTKLTPSEAANFGMQIAQGLAAAHSQKLIHRDMKPGNLWIEAPTGRVKILDFGLARKVLDDPQVTSGGAVIGTPAYMSPEQARGDNADHRCDLFSLGVILYEMTTGVRPFRGDDTTSLLTSLAIDEPTPPIQLVPEVPANFSKLICKLLEKKPQNRLQETQEVAQQLGQILKEIQHPVSTPTSTPKRERHISERVVPLVLLLLIGMGGGFAMLKLSNKPKDDPTQRATEGTIFDSLIGQKEDPKTSQTTLAERERQAAVWVIDTGGVVSINGQVKPIRDVRDLPEKDFQLTSIIPGPNAPLSGYDKFRGCKNLQQVIIERQVTDDVLAVFEGCEKISHLDLRNQTNISGRGFAHFRDCTQMKYLNLSGTEIHDHELSFLGRFTKLEIAHFSNTPLKGQFLEFMRKMSNITELSVDELPLSRPDWFVIKGYHKLKLLSVVGTPMNDEGLGILKDLKELESLFLTRTKITDTGLVHLRNYKKLQTLNLCETAVGDKGIKELAGSTELNFLNLCNTKITDEGTKHLIGLQKLSALILPLEVTDKSVPTLSALSSLRMLDAKGLTDDGAKKISISLPESTIQWKHGFLLPKK